MNSTELQEKWNALKDKKDDLKSKSWFRALVVIFSLVLFLLEGFVILTALTLESGETFAIGSIIILVIFFVVRKTVYYIIVGNVSTIKPEFKHTLEAKLKENEPK